MVIAYNLHMNSPYTSLKLCRKLPSPSHDVNLKRKLYTAHIPCCFNSAAFFSADSVVSLAAKAPASRVPSSSSKAKALAVAILVVIIYGFSLGLSACPSILHLPVLILNSTLVNNRKIYVIVNAFALFLAAPPLRIFLLLSCDPGLVG